MINKNRVRLLQEGRSKKGPILYWMSRDRRVNDNWALLFAQFLAENNNQILIVCFNVVPIFLEAAERQYLFMLKGLQQVEQRFNELNIPFKILLGNPEETIPIFIEENNVSILVSDFDPLRIKRIWKRDTAKKIKIPFYEVDAHNIVPCLITSNKMEFGAYTIRPKINKLLSEYLDQFPVINPQVKNRLHFKNNWNEINNSLEINRSVKEVNWIIPGEESAVEQLDFFLRNKLDSYNEKRNDPTLQWQSDLSPFLHFGQISAQRIAQHVKQFFSISHGAESFLEELIIRRELSDNFCYFNKNYDNFDGFPQWGKETLNQHKKDKREFIYSVNEFENGLTHDELWNAAQSEMVNRGKMHGYMRMYWAKKILEWSESPEEALRIAIYLNDKYELDGRDPNGYAGIAWSIGGLHDRAWSERPIFGKVRYMNYNGCKRKFDVDAYIKMQNTSMSS